MTILKDLCDFYELKRNELPGYGWSDEEVVFELHIRADGSLSGVVSYADDRVKHRLLRVPEHDERTSGAKPYFLCDNSKYFLGRDKKKSEAARKLHHDVLDDVDDPAVQALLVFLDEQKGVDCLSEAQVKAMSGSELLVFRHIPDDTLLHERAAFVDAWNRYRIQQGCGKTIQCSVTGAQGQAAEDRLFRQLKGIPGAQSSGTSLVSYNHECYCSYGLSTKDKLLNASLTDDTIFKSGTVLKYLARGNSHRIAIGGTQVVFWTDGERAPEREFVLAALNIGDKVLTGEDEALRERVKASLESIRKGLPVTGVDEATGYHLLGLAPNAGRLAVRFYETGTLGQLRKGLYDYLADLEMIDSGGESALPRSMGFYLRQIAPLSKSDNIPNTLIAAAMAAMLKGTSFPRELFMGALGRMRADKGSVPGNDVTVHRVSLMKGYLKRKARLARDTKAERNFTVALNENNKNTGYLLGRLFAALERAQGSALGNEVNATIRDRYIGAASATPAKVFPQLLRNAQHHISKANYGMFEERRIGEIVDCIESSEGFPPTLSYDDQGQFFIGYYQQKQAFYKKNDEKTIEQGDNNE